MQFLIPGQLQARYSRRELIVGLSAFAMSIKLSDPMFSFAQATQWETVNDRGDAATGEMPGPSPNWDQNIAELWRRTVEGTAHAPIAYGSALFYTGVGGSFLDPTIWIAAYDVQSGELVWENAWLNENAPDRRVSMPVVARDTIMFLSIEGVLYGFNTADGSHRWSFDYGSSEEYWAAGGLPAPVCVGDRVYISGNGFIYCVSISESPSMVWSLAIDARWPSITVDSDYLYVMNDAGDIRALRSEDGSEAWRVRPRPDKVTFGGYASRDGSFYYREYDSYGASGEGQGLTLCSVGSNGIVKWRTFLGGHGSSLPTVTPDRVLIAHGRDLRCLEVDTGRERWVYGAPGRLVGSPVFVGDMVYQAVDRLGVAAIQLSDGTMVRQFQHERVNTTPFISGGKIIANYAWGETESVAFGANDLVVEQPVLAPGTQAILIETAELRAAPGYSAIARETVEAGALVSITGNMERMDGEEWWPVLISVSGSEGWLPSSVLEAS
jgi:outer membrane protein assembly factor BamB